MNGNPISRKPRLKCKTFLFFFSHRVRNNIHDAIIHATGVYCPPSNNNEFTMTPRGITLKNLAPGRIVSYDNMSVPCDIINVYVAILRRAVKRLKKHTRNMGRENPNCRHGSGGPSWLMAIILISKKTMVENTFFNRKITRYCMTFRII